MTTDTFPTYRLKSGALRDYLKDTVFSGSPYRASILVEVKCFLGTAIRRYPQQPALVLPSYLNISLLHADHVFAEIGR